MSQTSAEGASDEVGSVADEAAKLIGSLADWTRQHAAGGGPPGSDCAHDREGPGDGQVGGARADATGACAWCPVCRASTWLRHLNPEARAHLGAAGASLAAAMASLLAPPAAGTGEGRVERIVVDDGAWPDHGE